MKTYVYDIECYKHYSCYVFKNNKEIITFEISVHNNQIKQLLKFITNKDLKLIGFNNIKYDNLILGHLIDLESTKSISNINTPSDIKNLLQTIYEASNSIINNQLFHTNTKFRSLDLYLINHYNNKARSCSLKQVEAAINFDNIQILPYELDIELTREQELDILKYCINDVEATNKLYDITKEEIKLRIDLSNEYNMDLMNKSSAVIGEKIIEYYLSKKINYDKPKIQDIEITVSDIIFDYINYSINDFNDIKDYFKNQTINVKTNFISEKEKEKYSQQLKEKFHKKINFKNAELVFGLGGIHGVNNNKVWTSSETHSILDIDVSSFYPNISIKNKLYPKHLSEDFCEVYEYIYELRQKYPKSSPINKALKLSLNGTYGKSREVNSFLYDPNYTYSITINGQLLILMLIDMLLKTNNIELIQANTDGITIYYPNELNNRIYHKCKEWETLTQLKLEYVQYKKFIFRDVNNYICQDINDKVKLKGEFEINKELHKDNSNKIVSLALKEYYINNIKPEDYIKSNNNILDYFCFEKIKSDCVLRKVYVENNKVIYKNLPKLTRYIIVDKKSKNKFEIHRRYSDGKIVSVQKGNYVLPCNDINILQESNYTLDKNHYIKETYKIINEISSAKPEVIKFDFTS
jgi:hypothetical protein